MYSAILKFFKKLGIPFCPRCDHPTLRADMCKSCAKDDNLAWDQFNALLEDDWVAQRGAEEAARHLLVDFEAYHLNQEVFLDDPDDELDFHGFDNDDDNVFGIVDDDTSDVDSSEFPNDEEHEDRADDYDDICPGICNQPAHACTCAETESLRRHNADPETRGSWFVA